MSQSKGTPRNPRINFHFKRPEFDFMFQWILGAQTNGGVEVGECFYAASEIREGNEESWISAWDALGARVLKRAETSLAGGHPVSARESYLRAYSYYRIPLVFISPVRQPERYRQQYRKARSCFEKAAALFDPPLERLKIPFGGKHLPGYFLPADNSGERRKTLIMIGGGDTFVEDLYAYIGPAGNKRGYHVLLVDLPGQGLLPFEVMTWRNDSEAPMRAVVDYALGRPEVDGEKLAAYGISGGGYLVPRAVTCEKRIKACVGCSIILDLTQAWNSRWIALYEKAEHSLLYRLAKALVVRWRSAYATMVDTYVWRFGAKSVQDLILVTKTAQVDPAQITCPTLNIMSEQEYAESPQFCGFAEVSQEKISHPIKKLVVLPQDEGADSHAIGTNLSLMSQTVFDWLDEVLDSDVS